MQKNGKTPNQNPKKPFELGGSPAKMDVSEVFAERTGSYLNEFRLFFAHFDCVPNSIQSHRIKYKKAHKSFLEKHAHEIHNSHFFKRYVNNKKEVRLEDAFYFLYEDLVVYFNCMSQRVILLFNKTPASKVEAVLDETHQFKKRGSKKKPEIMLLVSGPMGIETNPFKIKKPKLNIEDNYNADFLEIHQIISGRLSQKDEKGLVILYGKPGTGKTSYIRYLIGSLEKEIIFLPPNMASAITNPDLISVLTNNPNSIFVIEDAENVLVDRGHDGNSPVSTLLNISDGLLADCLNVQIICSFNVGLSKIDNALLRKGRLIAKYEFKELEAEKAQQLSKKLGYETLIDKPMTLNAIYNQGEKDFQQQEKNNRIGFQKSNGF